VHKTGENHVHKTGESHVHKREHTQWKFICDVRYSRM
jgi:hypothetical protein